MHLPRINTNLIEEHLCFYDKETSYNNNIARFATCNYYVVFGNFGRSMILFTVLA